MLKAHRQYRIYPIHVEFCKIRECINYIEAKYTDTCWPSHLPTEDEEVFNTKQ